MKKKQNKCFKSAIQCLSCKEILISRHLHDFRSCECGTFIDGGEEDYIRIGCKDMENGFKKVRIIRGSKRDFAELIVRLEKRIVFFKEKIKNLSKKKQDSSNE